MAGGYPTAFTVDGPRGPARVAQPGAAWLASASGHPIVPFHIEADTFWTVRSWDSHQVPKPGATLGVAIGAPVDVPSGADDEVIEAGRAAVQHALIELEVEAKALVRK
jgi:lysophospholipid acyltransferase (LPLAT)-like uncharacterized protein